MALFAGINTPTVTDPQNRAKQGSGNLGRGLLQLFSMQSEAAGAAAKAGEAKAAQEAGNAAVGRVANEVSQIRNSGGDTLKVMDVFRRNGDLFNNPATRSGMISLASNEKATEDMISGFEKAKIDTIQKQSQQKLLNQQVEMASKVAASGISGAKAVSGLFVPNDEGQLPVSNLTNFNTISSLYSEHVTGPEEARKAAEEAAAIARGDVQRTSISKTGVTKTFSPPPVASQDMATITEKFPEVEGSPAQPAQPAKKGFLGIGAKPATPAVPAVPASPEHTITRKVPVGKADTPAKTKIERANELSIAHPEWTKEQIIKAVNSEMP